jgi:hypothetical protein
MIKFNGKDYVYQNIKIFKWFKITLNNVYVYVYIYIYTYTVSLKAILI